MHPATNANAHITIMLMVICRAARPSYQLYNIKEVILMIATK
mgnify:CR=1 FL=1